MRARVHFHDGKTESQVLSISHIQNDGASTTGIVRFHGKKYEVSQSTTVHNANGTISKEWDIVGEVVASKWRPEVDTEW